MPSGTIYLLHTETPGPGRSRHYLGWSANLDIRLAAHRLGRGSRLTLAWKRQGVRWSCVASWPGDRTEERRLHQRHQLARLCPVCRRLALARHAAYERAARRAGRRPRKSRAAVA